MKAIMALPLALGLSLLAFGCSSPGSEGGGPGAHPASGTATPLLPIAPTAASNSAESLSGSGMLPTAMLDVGTQAAEPGAGPALPVPPYAGTPGSVPAGSIPDTLIPVALSILDGVNDVRQENGISALEGDGVLFSIAFARAQDMVDRNYLGHFDPQSASPLASVMMAERGFDGKLAENVSAVSVTFEDVARATLEAWGGSPAFRAVMLDPAFHYSGVGLNWDGQWWKVVQVFAEVRP